MTSPLPPSASSLPRKLTRRSTTLGHADIRSCSKRAALHWARAFSLLRQLKMRYEGNNGRTRVWVRRCVAYDYPLATHRVMFGRSAPSLPTGRQRGRHRGVARWTRDIRPCILRRIHYRRPPVHGLHAIRVGTKNVGVQRPLWRPRDGGVDVTSQRGHRPGCGHPGADLFSFDSRHDRAFTLLYRPTLNDD
jgi:hypothetical protein